MEFNDDIQKQNFIALMKTLEQISEDPNVPRNIRRMIAEALDTEDERIQILPLTPKIREEHKVPLNCNNVHLSRVQLIEENGYEFLCISEASNISVVHTEARPISDDHNDLLAVIHELAHAKMTRFLVKNLHKMEWIVKTYEVFFLGSSPNLNAYINTRFETYLSERFAWEIEIQALKSMYGKYFDIWPTRFPQSIMTEPSRDISKNISKSITAIYDGFILLDMKFGDKLISEILLQNYDI